MDLVKDGRTAHNLGFLLGEARGDAEVDGERPVNRIHLESVALDFAAFFTDNLAFQAIVSVGAGQLLRLLRLSARGHLAQDAYVGLIHEIKRPRDHAGKRTRLRMHHRALVNPLSCGVENIQGGGNFGSVGSRFTVVTSVAGAHHQGRNGD